jgi:hypothetical protein
VSETGPRKRLFRKYVLVVVALTGGVLLLGSAGELYFTYREAKSALVRSEQENAAAAAQEIRHFLGDIERQLRFVSGYVSVSQRDALAEREIDFFRLLRHVPAISDVRFIDAAGREQLVVSRFALNAVGQGRDAADDDAFVKTRSGSAYFGPVYFRNDSELHPSPIPGEKGNRGHCREISLRGIWDTISRILGATTGAMPSTELAPHAHPDISLVLRSAISAALRCCGRGRWGDALATTGSLHRGPSWRTRK